MPQIAHTGWKVISVDPSAYTVDIAGNPMYGYRIRFQTGAQNLGTVWLRTEDFSPANVGAAIDVKAALIDQVANMNSEPKVVDI